MFPRVIVLHSHEMTATALYASPSLRLEGGCSDAGGLASQLRVTGLNSCPKLLPDAEALTLTSAGDWHCFCWW